MNVLADDDVVKVVLVTEDGAEMVFILAEREITQPDFDTRRILDTESCDPSWIPVVAEVDAAHLQDDVVIAGPIAADFDYAEVIERFGEDTVSNRDVFQDDVDIPRKEEQLRRHQ